jgi:hypothetical protein
LKVWYDAVSGDSRRTTTLLSEAIQSARGSLFLLSPNWAASTWCNDEHEFGLTERRQDDSYLLVGARIDQIDIPPWFKIANVLDLRQFDTAAATQLLRAMAPAPPARLDNTHDVYFAGPWSRPTDASRATLDFLRTIGWRVVGDSPDHPHFADSVQRITSIVATSRGMVAVLPYDKGKPPAFTSPWIMEEVRIAQACGHPYVLLAEKGVQVPAEISSFAFGGDVVTLDGDGVVRSTELVLRDFEEEIERRPLSNVRAYSFLATSFLSEPQEMDNLVSVIERASNMPCLLGRDVTEQHVQEGVARRIKNAAFVIADVSDDNKNSLIEAGIAMGSGTPLHLICRRPDDGAFKRRFMFEDMEMNWYDNGLDKVGIVHKIARLYKRRVFAG